MGLMTTFVGLESWLESAVWLFIYAGWVVTVVRHAVPHPVWTVTLTGLFAGTYVGAIQVAFEEHYLRSNPWYAQDFGGTAREVGIALFVQAVGSGLVFGLIAGWTAYVLGRRRGECVRHGYRIGRSALFG
jgi:hypothetical protein